MPRALALAVLVLAPALAGCAEPTAPAADVGLAALSKALAFEPMRVRLTPGEPGETPPLIEIAWGATTFGARSSDGREFPPFAVREGRAIYASQTGERWVKHDAADGRARGFAPQAFLWDLRYVLAMPGVSATRTERAGGLDVEGRGTLDATGAPMPFAFTLRVENGRITRATIDAPGARESPYTLTAATADVLTTPPRESRAAADVERLDRASAEAHAFVVTLVEAHARNRAGLLPERVDRDALAIEVAASGRNWPDNPYTGAPLAAGRGPGDLRWTRCEPTVGHYAGTGWDGVLLTRAFGGKACAASP
ncbi:MAG TPA: hypothetical protein VM889_07325 [Candidatus Thermoplasmatota archaeon]|nr:hypothetical protein [Candidatus Thermoplasmatota archaeon]